MEYNKREVIARVCHEANRVLQSLTGETVSGPWEDAAEFARASTYSGIESLEGKAGSPWELAAGQHDEWLRYKELQGWKYGPVKDAEAKTHPLMVPFAELSPVDQAKDTLFVTIVQSLINHLGE